MKYIYIKGTLKRKIVMKKFGIKIRKLNIKDKERIIKEYNYLKENKKNLDNLLNSYISFSNAKNYDIKFLEWLVRFVVICRHNNSTSIDLKLNINSLINKIVTIEIDDMLFKYIDENEINDFVFKLIDLSYLVTRKNKYIFDRLNLKTEHNYSITQDSTAEMDVISNFLKKPCKIEYLNSNVVSSLSKLTIFINKLCNEEIERFINIVRLLYTSSDTYTNNILNNVLSIEGIIISDKENIEKNFILKCGIILNEIGIKYNNVELSEIMRFIYHIRSDIVHGNIKKINGDYDRLKSKIDNVEKILERLNKTVKNEKEIPYYIASAYSNLVLFNVFKYWINDKNKIDYIRNN